MRMSLLITCIFVAGCVPPQPAAQGPTVINNDRSGGVVAVPAPVWARPVAPVGGGISVSVGVSEHGHGPDHHEEHHDGHK